MEVGKRIGSPNKAIVLHLKTIEERNKIRQEMKANFKFVDKSLEVTQTLSDNFIKQHL